MTEEICDDAVNRCFFLYLIIFLTRIKLKNCVIELFLKILFIVYCPDKCINQKICEKAVDDSI